MRTGLACSLLFVRRGTRLRQPLIPLSFNFGKERRLNVQRHGEKAYLGEEEFELKGKSVHRQRSRKKHSSGAKNRNTH